MTLPDGWIDNQPAPERGLPEYTGDPTSKWEAQPGENIGAQPKTPGNPDGEIGSVPVMSMGADAASRLGGSQPRR